MHKSSLLKQLKAVWYKSWTSGWAKAQGITGALLFSLSQLNSYISDPAFKSYLDMIDVPKSVTIALAVIGIITWLAHGRED